MNSVLGRPTNKLQRPAFPSVTGLCSNLPKGKVAGPSAALSKCWPSTTTIWHANTITPYSIPRYYIPAWGVTCCVPTFKTITVKLVMAEDSFKPRLCPLWRDVLPWDNHGRTESQEEAEGPCPCNRGRREGGRQGGARRTERGQIRLESQEEAIKCFFLNSLKTSSPDGILRYKTQKTPWLGQ